MRTYDDSVRESLFTQLGVLVSIVRANIRCARNGRCPFRPLTLTLCLLGCRSCSDYLDSIFEIVHEYLPNPNLLESIVVLIEKSSLALGGEFKVIPDQCGLCLGSLPIQLEPLNFAGLSAGSAAAAAGGAAIGPHRQARRHPQGTSLQSIHRRRLLARCSRLRSKTLVAHRVVVCACRCAPIQVLRALETFGSNLEDYLHLAVPSIVRLFEQPDAPVLMRQKAIFTTGQLCRQLDFGEVRVRFSPLCSRPIRN
jgi:hypothetical protein